MKSNAAATGSTGTRMPSCQMAVSEAKYSKRSSLMDKLDFHPHSHLPSLAKGFSKSSCATVRMEELNWMFVSKARGPLSLPAHRLSMNSSERDSERECRIWADNTCLGLLLNSLR